MARKHIFYPNDMTLVSAYWELTERAPEFKLKLTQEYNKVILHLLFFRQFCELPKLNLRVLFHFPSKPFIPQK